jgi:hypothetical protein
MKHIATFVLLIAESASAGTAPIWIHVKGGSWEPSEAVLVELGGHIQEYVTSEAARTNAELQPWESYRFQYQGKIEGKRQVIFINAFCHSFGDERLDDEMLFVLDGGACYFTLEYDPQARKFRSLRFNGYA